MRVVNRVAWALLLALPLAGCGGNSGGPGGRPVKVGFVPKLIGIPYFNACERGAREAAKELGLELVYNGPTSTDVNAQIALIDQWAAGGEAIAVLNLDAPPPEEAIKEVRSHPQISSVSVVKLPPPGTMPPWFG